MIYRGLRRLALFGVSLLLVAAAWQGYKLVGPADGGTLFGWEVLPRSRDSAMPHVWEMFARFGDPVTRGSDEAVWQTILAASWYSLRIAFVGFAIGVLVGVGLAVLMARLRFVERGLMPYLVVSQTVPLIALAPLVTSWGGQIQLGEWVWPPWMSVAVLGAFLAFFPVAVGTLRGLKSAPAASLELMDSYAAGWWTTLVKLRFPAAVAHIVPSLRLAATGSVVGVVVAEISTGRSGGIGRRVIEYLQADRDKVYAAVFGAAAVGMVMAGIVVTVELIVMRNRPKEQTS